MCAASPRSRASRAAASSPIRPRPARSPPTARAATVPYAKALAETIVEPGQGIEEIFRDVRAKVLAATDNKQTPWDSSSLTAPFYFQAPAAVAATDASTALSGNPQAAELLFWESIKDSKSSDDFQAYLDKYPQGEYVALAKNRLKGLGAVAAAASAPPDSTIRNMAPGKDEETAKAYEDAFWGSVQDSDVADDIQAYLNKYPHGRYVGQAQQKLKALGKTSLPPLLQSVAPPQSVPPPLPPFADVDQQIYTRDRARLRATPDKNAEVVGRVAAGAALKATGRTADSAWWRVALDDGKTGYIAGSIVSDQPPAAAVALPAPSVAPAQQASAAPPPSSTAAAPAGKDEDICPSDSSAAPADRIAALPAHARGRQGQRRQGHRAHRAGQQPVQPRPVRRRLEELSGGDRDRSQIRRGIFQYRPHPHRPGPLCRGAHRLRRGSAPGARRSVAGLSARRRARRSRRLHFRPDGDQARDRDEVG